MAPSLLIDRARQQRQAMGDAEGRLWYALRGRRFLGYKFRRQVPIGPFIADFACKSARLVIETDGEQHGNDEQERKDALRTRWLEYQGWRVQRFWTAELASNMDGVLETILIALGEADSDAPSP